MAGMLGLKKKGNKLAGLDIGSFFLKLVILEIDEKGGLHLVAAGKRPLNPGQIVEKEIRDHEGLVYSIQSLVEELDPKLSEVVIAVSGHKVLVDRVELSEPGGKGKRYNLLKDKIIIETGQRIPSGVDSVQVDFVELDSDGKKVILLLVAARRELVDDYVSLAVDAGVVPTIVGLEAFSVFDIFEHNYDISPDVGLALADIGHSTTNVVFILDGKVYSVRDIAHASKNVWSRLQSELKLTADDLKRFMSTKEKMTDNPVLRRAMYNAAEELSAGLGMAFSYFENMTGGVQINKLYLSGGGVGIPHLVDSLSSRLGVPCLVVNPLEKISYDPAILSSKDVDIEKAVYSVALGLALRGREKYA